MKMLHNRLLFTLLTVITLNTCIALPSQKFPIAYNLHQELSARDVNDLGRYQRDKAVSDVQTTIDEVQKLLASDPTLPRLTKGEIKDLFEKAAKSELEKSILNGDQSKQDHMRHLIQALPFHSDEIETLEELNKKSATTQVPDVEPEIPSELKQLFASYGLIDNDGKPIQLSQLPIAPDADSPTSLLLNSNAGAEETTFSLEDLHDQVKKASLVKAQDYEAFKPLEVDQKNVSSDMESFLKKFGLIDREEPKRRKVTKSSKLQSFPSIDSSYLLPGYSSLLDNIGITTIKDKNAVKKVNLRPTSNVFKPNSKNHEEDFKKLEILLDTIRELEKLNGSLTEKEVEKLNLQNFNFSDTLFAGGPDPVYQSQLSALKNEVKRQNSEDKPTKLSLGVDGDLLESSSLEATDDSVDDTPSEKTESSSTTTTTTTEKPETTTSAAKTTSTTEEAKKNTLEDEIEPVDDPEPLPPPRRSGFYMLLDWNSFLEVGDEDKVVIRFDPKIGDPSRFLPVNVP